MNKYKVDCTFTEIEETDICNFEKVNLKAIKAFNINGIRYLIKPIRGYISKYALVVLSTKGRAYKVVAVSDSITFLESFVRIRFGVNKILYSKGEKEFLNAR